MSRIDLHIHTTHSDGSLRPSEILALAKQADVTALAITDHDITTGIPEALVAGNALGIEVIPGVEISAFDGKGEIHLLGYGIQWQDLHFNERLMALRASRHRRNPLIVERLRESGLDITYEEVQTLAGTESVGRPHIAQLLMLKKYVASAKEAFDRYLAEGKPAYIARDLPSPAEAIGWIREAKGVAVLAHPTWVKVSSDGLLSLVSKLKESGLGGIEVYYSTHSQSDTNRYLALSKKFDLLATGGSDFHGQTKPDIAVGSGRGGLRISSKLLAPLHDAVAKL